MIIIMYKTFIFLLICKMTSSKSIAENELDDDDDFFDEIDRAQEVVEVPVMEYDYDNKPIPIRDVWAVKDGKAELPCDIAPPDPTDQIYLVLWYRELAGKPLYSYDLRGKPPNAGRHWSAEPTFGFGQRANFRVPAAESNTALVIKDVSLMDEGVYRCRVDYRNSPTRNMKLNLTVVECCDGKIVKSISSTTHQTTDQTTDNSTYKTTDKTTDLTTEGVTAKTTTQEGEGKDWCEVGWIYFNHTEKCYKYYPEQMTPTDASIYCKKNKGLLASIHDILTNNFISNITNDYPVWIGGLKQKSWIWEDGSLWDYAPWAPNEPNNQLGNKNYLMTNWPSRGEWNDASNSYKFHLVCQANGV